MHTNPSLQHPDPVDYPAPKKYVLVLSCVDARLLDDLIRFLDHDNLTNRYYHVTLAGTSLGTTERWKKDVEDPDNPPANFRAWRESFVNHVQAAVTLTHGGISDIYIVQHKDCGAFRVYCGLDSSNLSDQQEQEMHYDYACALVHDLAENFCEIYNPVDHKTNKKYQDKKPNVHAFYMDLRGEVQHLHSHYPSQSDGTHCVETKSAARTGVGKRAKAK